MRFTPQLETLERASEALGPLTNDLVFVGGSVVTLLLTDSAAAPPRATNDIDVLVEVASLVEYYRVGERLRQRQFSEDVSGGVICRWNGHGLILDVIPTEESVFGFSNAWHRAAAANAVWEVLPNGRQIMRVDAPHFVATKFEAFRNRGGGDPYLSHDLEDIVAVLDGRLELEVEMAASPSDVRAYVVAELETLAALEDIEGVIEGHLGSLTNAGARVPILLERLRRIVKDSSPPAA